MENKLINTGQNSIMDNFIETDDILKDMRQIIESSQKAAHQAVNMTLVQRNWMMGYRMSFNISSVSIKLSIILFWPVFISLFSICIILLYHFLILIFFCNSALTILSLSFFCYKSNYTCFQFTYSTISRNIILLIHHSKF